MDLGLRGKVALVTGAGSGIGEAAARLLAEEGASVGVLSRTGDEVRDVAAAVIKAGGKALPLEADVADEPAMEAAARALASEFGGIDIVIANAGINGPRAPFEELTAAEFDTVTAINQRGTFITIQQTLPHLRERGGAIVVTSSVNGNVLFNDPGSVIYTATKAAQLAMVKVLAIEFAAHKVRINAVLPGTIQTEIDDNTQRRHTGKIPGRDAQFPQGEIPLTGKKPGKPEQVARLIAFLASGASDHITGAGIVVDGGQSLIS